MIQHTVKKHFELEKDYLTQSPRIKPLTLFFIDNIEEYRNKEGSIHKVPERAIKEEAETLLTKEPNLNPAYKSYLEKTQNNIPLTHGEYFSKDNASSDEKIEKEVNEILHDKQSMLDINNVRRFIFSKWTLKEGWDNPNIFQICKLCSSGSEISKLQELGRGLRLPVNEYGYRVNKQFYLNYIVDFTKEDFVEKLAGEVNKKSGVLFMDSEKPNTLTEEMINAICKEYKITDKDDFLQNLQNKNIITRSNSFKEGGFDFIKKEYPNIFNKGIDSNKIRIARKTKSSITIRKDKYRDLKNLWEKINEKVIITYKIENEDNFKKLLIAFLEEEKLKLASNNIGFSHKKLEINNERQAFTNSSQSVESFNPINILIKYSDFLKRVSADLYVNIETLHQAISSSGMGEKINQYRTEKTCRMLKQNFNIFLMSKVFSQFEIGYQKVSCTIYSPN